MGGVMVTNQHPVVAAHVITQRMIKVVVHNATTDKQGATK